MKKLHFALKMYILHPAAQQKACVYPTLNSHPQNHSYAPAYASKHPPYTPNHAPYPIYAHTPKKTTIQNPYIDAYYPYH